VIVAEAGGDMSVCQQHPPRRPGGLAPGDNEPAGKRKKAALYLARYAALLGGR
jgi:hypothetical protein